MSVERGVCEELRGMVNYLLEQAQRREEEASRHPADSPTRIHFAAMAEADRDTATELGILARQFAQAHADQQARLRALVGKWRDKSATDGLFIDVAFPGDTVGRIANQQRNRCADELEAVLGGKE